MGNLFFIISVQGRSCVQFACMICPQGHTMELKTMTEQTEQTEQTETQKLIKQLREKTEAAIIVLKGYEQKDRPNAALWIIYHLWDCEDFGKLEKIVKARKAAEDGAIWAIYNLWESEVCGA